MNADRLLPLIFLLSAAPTPAASLDAAHRTAGSAVTAAFEPQRAVLQKSSAVVHDGRRDIGFAVVISEEGYLLAKASEVMLVKAPAVTVDGTKFSTVKVLAVDPVWDVALLKADATGWVPVTFAPSEPAVGSWVVANAPGSRSTRRALAGIVSAKAREIPLAGGAALGVGLNPDEDRAIVTEVFDKSGAFEAGLRKGDQIVAIGDRRVATPEEVDDALKDRKAGSRVRLTFRRGDAETPVEVRLASRGEFDTDAASRPGGGFSPRRSGFPRVIQHDLPGTRATQGGPLLDLDGRCVGMNIARVNRAESYAIPAAELKEIAARLIRNAP